MSDADPRWAEVKRLRAESDERLKADDIDAVYALDGAASALAQAIFKDRRTEKRARILEIRKITAARMRRTPWARRMARVRFAAIRRRRIVTHGIDKVRAEGARYRRSSYENTRGERPRRVSLASKGPATMAAIDAARGNLRAAQSALGIAKSVFFARVESGVVTIGGEAMSVRAWLDRTWPQRAGHRATPVLRVDVEGTGKERVYVYALAAHGDVADGEHVNRVRAEGVVRARVVCKVCKEKRST